MPEQPPRLRLKSKYVRPPQATTTERGYGSAHQKARRAYLAAHPICQRCEDSFSTDLHHRDRNPFNRNPGNFEALCETCHHAGAHGK